MAQGGQSGREALSSHTWESPHTHVVALFSSKHRSLCRASLPWIRLAGLLNTALGPRAGGFGTIASLGERMFLQASNHVEYKDIGAATCQVCARAPFSLDTQHVWKLAVNWLRA